MTEAKYSGLTDEEAVEALRSRLKETKRLLAEIRDALKKAGGETG